MNGLANSARLKQASLAILGWPLDFTSQTRRRWSAFDLARAGVWTETMKPALGSLGKRSACREDWEKKGTSSRTSVRLAIAFRSSSDFSVWMPFSALAETYCFTECRFVKGATCARTQLRDRAWIKWCQRVVQTPMISPGFLAAAGNLEDEVEEVPADAFNGGFSGCDAACIKIDQVWPTLSERGSRRDFDDWGEGQTIGSALACREDMHVH